MNESLKSMLVMIIISAGAAALLAMVRDATADRIRISEGGETRKAIALLLPAGVKIPEGASFDMEIAAGKTVTAYPGYAQDGSLSALAVKTWSKSGYSGRIDLMLGYGGLAAGEKPFVNRIYVLAHAETPGLGSKATDCQKAAKAEDCPPGTFWKEFVGVPLEEAALQVTKDNPNGRIHGITSATISSRAITGAVREAGLYVTANLDELRTRAAAVAGGAK